MISGQNIVKYLLICVFTQLLMVNFSFASPVPVFCFYNFGFIKNSPQWNNACKGIRYIQEYKNGFSTKPYKSYSLENGYIQEYKNGFSTKPYKSYSLENGYIQEYKNGFSTKPYKSYSLENGYIQEYKNGFSIKPYKSYSLEK